MPNYTIDNFWKPLLSVQKVTSPKLLKGWSFHDNGHETFKEAPLTKSEEFGNDGDPANSPVLLVSAAGAVGKSTWTPPETGHFRRNAIHSVGRDR